MSSEVTSLDISDLPPSLYGTTTIQAEFSDGRLSDPTPVVVIALGTDSESGQEFQEFQSGDIGGTFWTAKPITNFDGFRGEIFAYERQFEKSVQDIDAFSIELQTGQVLVVDIDAKISGAFQSRDGKPVGNAKEGDFSYIQVPGVPTGFPSSLSADVKVYYESDEGMVFIEPSVNTDSDYQGDPYREYQAQASGTYYIFIYGKEGAEGNYLFYKEVVGTVDSPPTISNVQVFAAPTAKAGQILDLFWQSNNQGWFFLYLYDTKCGAQDFQTTPSLTDPDFIPCSEPNKPVNTGGFLSEKCRTAQEQTGVDTAQQGCLWQEHNNEFAENPFSSWIVPSQLPAGLYRIKVAIWNDENEDHAVGAFSNPFVVE
jgi:hypothetical protein